MKSFNIKFIKVFSDGSVNFSSAYLKQNKQVVFNEKDVFNSLFYKKSTKNQYNKNLIYTSYKSKYKF